jgi:molybdenum cofactor cytidylyltransferase
VTVALETCFRVRVVVGPGLSPPGDLPVELVVNPDWEEGMASSIRLGIEGVESPVLITLCDQPLVTSTHLRNLIAAHTPDAPIVATGYRGIAGVPAFFAAELLGELRSLRGDRGARAIIAAHGALVIPFEDAGFDVDTAKDAREL